MATAMLMDWPETSLEDYGAVMNALRLDEDPPDGGIFHVAGMDGTTLRILDVWESEDKWNAFLTHRLTPAIQSAGLEGHPNVRTYPIANVYAPDAAALESLGAPTPTTA
jgi:hypothetical protein